MNSYRNGKNVHCVNIEAGYRDSGSDIAYVLRHRCNIQVITPAVAPNPQSDEGWCFPDNEHGILDAVERGATHLWANTILFANHPLQTSSKLTLQEKKVHVVGQPPLLVEIYDDKDLVNTWLRKHKGLTVPRFFSLNELNDLEPALAKNKMQLPLVAKPVRGRGSHGVKACFTFSELAKHVHRLLGESPTCMVEEFLAGQEITITVMPPSPDCPKHWALPIVTRFNHERGIAPYNGLVAVTRNSKVISSEEYESDPLYSKAVRECENVAKLLNCTAPIRIDMRRLVDKIDSPFAIFDVNMKPVSTNLKEAENTSAYNSP